MVCEKNFFKIYDEYRRRLDEMRTSVVNEAMRRIKGLFEKYPFLSEDVDAQDLLRNIDSVEKAFEKELLMLRLIYVLQSRYKDVAPELKEIFSWYLDEMEKINDFMDKELKRINREAEECIELKDPRSNL